MEILVVLLCIVVLGLIYVVYTTNLRSKSSSTNELIQFSNSLSSQIQEIRKEIDSNSKESRKEFDLKLDNDEFITVVKMDVKKLIGMIKAGKIIDSKTICAVMIYAAKKKLF